MIQFAISGGRWFLPFLCVIAASAGLAHAAEDAFSTNVFGESNPTIRQELGGQELSVAAPSSSEFHWVVLMYRGPSGLWRIECLAKYSWVGDTLFDETEELLPAAAGLCQATRDIVSSGLR